MRRLARFAMVTAVVLALLRMPGVPQQPANAPAHRLVRVVGVRPASAGALAPDGYRFTYVHNDNLWLSDLRTKQARRIGAPDVNRVYQARWASNEQILVNQVLPDAGDALGVLDLARGRFRIAARQVREGDYHLSRGGLLVWQSTLGTKGLREAWAGTLGADGLDRRRLGASPGAFALFPAPAGGVLAGLSRDGRLYVQRMSTGVAQAFAADAEERATAPAWTHDGTRLACLMQAASGVTPEGGAATTGPAGGQAARSTIAIFRPEETHPEKRVAAPAECRDLKWDAEGKGLLCRTGGEEAGLWYVPVDEGGAPRRLCAGSVSGFAGLAGGHALAVVAANESADKSDLCLMNVAGTLQKRLTNLQGFNLITDVSADRRKVLLTRGNHDDREELFPHATVWLFELL